MPTSQRSGDAALWLIGGFKLAKGLVLLGFGLGVLRLMHHDVADVLGSWSARLHVDPDNRYIDRVLGALTSLDDRRLKAIGAGTFCYAALLFTEGIGLLLQQRWAEYLTVIVTGSLIPLELYELARRVTVARLMLLAVNIVIVWYLVGRLRRERHDSPKLATAPPAGRPS